MTPAETPPPPSGGGVSAAAGAFGPTLLAPLALLTLLRRRRPRRLAAMLAAPLLALLAALAPARADELHFDTHRAYLGLRLGEGIYGQGSSDLARDLAGQGDAVSGVRLQKHRFAGAVYGGVPVWDGLGVEAGFVQLGKYEAFVDTSGSLSKVTADVARKLQPAGQGITLGFGGEAPLLDRLSLGGHIAMLIYTSTQEAHSAAGTFKQTRQGVGAALATAAMYRFSDSIYGGVGVDAYIERGGLALILPNAQLEYHFGR